MLTHYAIISVLMPRTRGAVGDYPLGRVIFANSLQFKKGLPPRGLRARGP